MVGRYYTSSRPDVAPFLPPSFTRTLEIGCGTGEFSSRYLNPAMERWGIEPSAIAANAARSNFTYFFQGTYDEVAISLPEHYFDLIIVNDVIEHMNDHDFFLQSIKAKLKPNAYLVGSIPNVRHFTVLVKLLLARDWPYQDDGILDRTHLRFFTEKSFRRTSEINGYAIEKLHGIRSIVIHGVTGQPPAKDLLARLVMTVLLLLSIGYFADAQYPQFGFRIRLLA